MKQITDSIQLDDRFASPAIHFIDADHRKFDIAFRGQCEGHVLCCHLVDGLLSRLDRRLHLRQ